MLSATCRRPIVAVFGNKSKETERVQFSATSRTTEQQVHYYPLPTATSQTLRHVAGVDGAQRELTEYGESGAADERRVSSSRRHLTLELGVVGQLSRLDNQVMFTQQDAAVQTVPRKPRYVTTESYTHHKHTHTSGQLRQVSMFRRT